MTLSLIGNEAALTKEKTMPHHPMLDLFSADHWRKKRADYMQGARGCRDALLKQGYARDDERVKKALEFWVYRARNAHAFALGRKPVIPNMAVITNEGAFSLPMYAK